MMVRSAHRIEWRAGEWHSVFPPPYDTWNRSHETIMMAYDYMRDDAKVTSYIEVVPKLST
jgi:hypothetical protein